MRVICAPDSFKGTLTARAAAEAMAEGVRDAEPGSHATVCPVGDGGEGTLDALVAAMQGELRRARATGPLGEPRDAGYGIVRETRLGIVELAAASGLTLVPEDRRDPMRTTTRGTGELIRRAIDDGSASIIVGVGGSATVDGGTGLAQALGARFFDEKDRPIPGPMCGADLRRIRRVVPVDPRQLVPIRVACDVNNPLCGPNGAAAVYGPQKGATPEQVAELDRGLAHLAALADADPGTPSAGAAGGAAFGLMAFCGATLEPGIDLVLDVLRFAELCRGADLVLTGEGRLDAQSLSGKACLGVARAAAAQRIPTIAIVGDIDAAMTPCTREHGGPLLSCVSLVGRVGRDRALRDAAAALRETTRAAVRSFRG